MLAGDYFLLGSAMLPLSPLILLIQSISKYEQKESCLQPLQVREAATTNKWLKYNN